jgi:transcriptional regulator with XRE-family HTH domain
MANERLRSTLASRRITVERLAEEVEVDPKIVQRWLAGRTPHARHRWAVAAVLHEDERYLWPPQGSGSAVSGDVEFVAAHTHRADVPPDDWWDLFTGEVQPLGDTTAIKPAAMVIAPFRHGQHLGFARWVARKSGLGRRAAAVRRGSAPLQGGR